MDNYKFYDDGVTRVLAILKDTFGDSFREYYDDELSNIPESALPCIMVREGDGTVESGATGTDDLNETIVIILALNQKDDFGADSNLNLTGAKLRRLVKGQDPVTRQYHPQTVMYALRKHYTLGDAVLNSSISIDFDMAQRGERLFTKEAYVTISIERQAFVPERD